MPSHTKVSFAPATVKRIAENKNVIGFKDSSADGVYFHSVRYEMRDRSDFSFFVGPEAMMAEVVLMGADGGVSGGANIFPKLFVDLYNAASAGKIDEVRRLQSKVLQISDTIYTAGNYGSSLLKGIKCSLSILGICSDYVAAPFNRFDTERRKMIAKAIDELQIIM